MKNSIVPLEITGMTTEGHGVGKYEGLAVFVPLSAIGDKLLVRIVKMTKNFAYGKIESIEVPSKDRISVDCEYFNQCGGCSYRHISYEAELAIKEQAVKDAVSRIGGFTDVKVNPIVSAESRRSYRNKAILPIGALSDNSLSMGFYALNSHRIVDCQMCRLQPEEFNVAMNSFRQWHKKYGDSVYDENSHRGKIRRLFLRKAESGVMVGVVTNSSCVKNEDKLLEMLKNDIPNLESFIINTNTQKTNVALGNQTRLVYGSESLTDKLCGLEISFTPLSFYQVNRIQTEKLYEKASEYANLTGDEILLDLYCGVGTIGLSMADKVKKIIGVEVVEPAIKMARLNAKQNNIANAEFICADAAQAAVEMEARGEKPDVIIVDPPRKGCDFTLLETIAKMQPSRLVYVSCNPATLARDMKLLSELGFKASEVTPVDMFPATSHVETVVLLSRKGS